MILRRTNKGGSVATFVAVGIILIAVLAGGVYILNRRGEQIRTDQATAVEKAKQLKTTTSGGSNKTKTVASSTANEKTVVNQSTTSSSHPLPDTGIQIKTSELVGVFVLTVTTAGYYLSRRRLSRSL